MQTVVEFKSKDELTRPEIESCYKLVRKIRGMYLATPEGWNKRRKIEELTETPNLQYILIKLENEIVAFTSFEKNDRDLENQLCTYIWEFHVSDKHRRQHLGKQLMSQLIEISEHDLLLRCFNNNLTAIQFYEAMGFKELVKYKDRYCTLFKYDQII